MEGRGPINQEDELKFICPGCGSGLVFPGNSDEITVECPHCYAVVTLKTVYVEAAGNSESDIVEKSPLEYPRSQDRDYSITNVFFLFVISLFMRFIFPIPTFVLGAFLTQFAFVSYSSMNEANPLRLLISIPLIAASIHSFSAGRSLARIAPGAIRAANVFLGASAGYSLLCSIGFAVGFASQYTTSKQIGMAITAWLLFAVPIIVCLCLYLNLSKRVQALYQSGNP